jgi:hypothetical protein
LGDEIMISWNIIFLGGFSVLSKFSALGTYYFHKMEEKNSTKNKQVPFILIISQVL